MVLFGQTWLYSGKVAVCGQSDCIWSKVVVLVQSGCNRAELIVFGQKWLYSGKSGCIRSKLVIFGKKLM